jgi:molybdopterin-biosynthesis enzyme MoeA-like protein
MDIVQKLKNWKHWATGGQKIVLEETIAEIEELRKENHHLSLKFIEKHNESHNQICLEIKKLVEAEEEIERLRKLLNSHAKTSEDKGQR